MWYYLSIEKRYFLKGGVQVNKKKLKAAIAEHGETQKILAEALGISRVTLCRKMSEKENFSL